MARYAIAPTKTNLLRLQAEHSFVTEGHQLLEQKKDILTAELLSLMDSARAAEAEMDRALAVAFEALRKAIVRMGRGCVASTSYAFTAETSASVTTRRIMGITLPKVVISVAEPSLTYAPAETSFWIDEVSVSFREAAKHLAALLETKMSLARLAREVNKTIRRVNALEKIALPDLEETLKYIRDALQEMERETFFTMKLIKNRLAERRSRSGRW